MKNTINADLILPDFQLTVAHTLAKLHDHCWAKTPLADLRGQTLADIFELGRVYWWGQFGGNGVAPVLDDARNVIVTANGIRCTVRPSGALLIEIVRPFGQDYLVKCIQEAGWGHFTAAELAAHVEAGAAVVSITLPGPSALFSVEDHCVNAYDVRYGADGSRGEFPRCLPRHLVEASVLVLAVTELYGSQACKAFAWLEDGAGTAVLEEQKELRAALHGFIAAVGTGSDGSAFAEAATTLTRYSSNAVALMAVAK